MAAAPGAEKEGRIKEQREASAAHIEGQQQQRRQQHHAEKGVQKPGQVGPGMTGGPQQVVEEAQSGAGGGGLHKLGRLKENRLFHQPKSRAKKPPPVGCSSS